MTILLRRLAKELSLGGVDAFWPIIREEARRRGVPEPALDKPVRTPLLGHYPPASHYRWRWTDVEQVT